MPVKIRLARRGRKKRPYYHIVIADSRRSRDGKFIENIGFYNPMTIPATIELDQDKAFDWLMKGAQPTDTTRAILKFKGVYYKKHLLRGVQKGALTEETAEKMLQEWIEAKEAKVQARREGEARKQEEFWKMVSGEIKQPKKSADKEAGAAFRESEDDSEAGTEEVSAEAGETEEVKESTDKPAEKAEAKAEESGAEATAAEEAKESAEKPAAETAEKPAEKAEAKEEAEAAASEEPAEAEESPAQDDKSEQKVDDSAEPKGKETEKEEKEKKKEPVAEESVEESKQEEAKSEEE